MTDDPQPFVARYQVSDGYAGGARPQSCKIDAGDIDADMSDDELAGIFDDAITNDMFEKVSAERANFDEFMSWAKAIRDAAKEAR